MNCVCERLTFKILPASHGGLGWREKKHRKKKMRTFVFLEENKNDSLKTSKNLQFGLWFLQKAFYCLKKKNWMWLEST